MIALVADAAVPALYDVSTVHISVTDDNDNRPVFTHPSSVNNDTAVIQLTSAVHVGHVVIQVTATDDDTGINARLNYSISSQDVELFAIDEDSGEVTVATPLPYSIHAVMYNVVIAVSDAGTPRLTSQTLLHVLVSEAASLSGRPSAVDVVSRRSTTITEMGWWLVIGGCTAGLLIIFTTLCLLVVIHRTRRQRTKSTTVTTTTTTTPRTSSLSRRKTQAPTPLVLMTDIDPLTSAALRRHQFDDVTLLDQRAGPTGNYFNYLQSSAGCGDVTCNSAPVSSLRLYLQCVDADYGSLQSFASIFLSVVFKTRSSANAKRTARPLQKY